ncbi:hypothetical protein [Halorientalis salina]|uniref:hypothetical protein n=1 Tax=Halorientalis salina TaxID=2932266 RepID=UPI0010ABB195|nr:hypothetical protein [Halorientalis salina]
MTEYDPDCLTDSKVWVNNHRLPAGDVDLYMRKEGPLDVTRYVEGKFASPWNDEDFTKYFNLLPGNDPLVSESQDLFDTLRVDVRDTQDTEDAKEDGTVDEEDEGNIYHTQFMGVVTGVGSSISKNEKEWAFRARGPGMFVDKIPASKTFTNGSTQNILRYVKQQIEGKYPFEISVDNTNESFNFDTNPGINLVEGAINQLPLLGNYEIPGGSKTFKKNQDTLEDVLTWLDDKVGIRLWFEPTPNGAVLVGTDTPTATEHNAHYLDGETYILNNDALVEINPVNTLTVKSKVTDSLGVDGVFEIKEIKTGNEYNIAKVRHQPLYEKAGRREFIAAPDALSDADTKNGLVNEAKSMLKTEIDEATGGDMSTLLNVPVKPYDTIVARPTCVKSDGSDVDPVTYEVSRVHHEIKAGGVSRTNLNVGLHAALGDIEKVSVETEKV